MIRVVIIITFILTVWPCAAQEHKICESFLESPDTLATYKEGKKSLHQYVQAKLIPILGDCIKQKMEFVNSMTIKIFITATGKVDSVAFLKPVLSDYCKGKLTAEILLMDAWFPGKYGAKPVCSTFTLPIGSIKWQ